MNCCLQHTYQTEGWQPSWEWMVSFRYMYHVLSVHFKLIKRHSSNSYSSPHKFMVVVQILQFMLSKVFSLYVNVATLGLFHCSMNVYECMRVRVYFKNTILLFEKKNSFSIKFWAENEYTLKTVFFYICWFTFFKNCFAKMSLAKFYVHSFKWFDTILLFL